MSNTRVLREQLIVTDSLRRRFMSHVVEVKSGCWHWTGALNPNGYGKVKLQGRAVDTHVASWRIHNSGRPVPVGKLVMHSCDVRHCVNPDHLSIGDTSRNMKDARDRDRLDIVYGERHPGSVLTNDLVREIRRLYKPRKFGATRIGRILGLKRRTVDGVIHGERWAHVDANAPVGAAHDLS